MKPIRNTSLVAAMLVGGTAVSCMAVEQMLADPALTDDELGGARLPLPHGARIRVEIGPRTFVARVGGRPLMLTSQPATSGSVALAGSSRASPESSRSVTSGAEVRASRRGSTRSTSSSRPTISSVPRPARAFGVRAKLMI